LPVYAWDGTRAGSGPSPWFSLPSSRELGVFVAGDPGGSDTWALEWGQIRDGEIEPLGLDEVVIPPRDVGSNPTWHFLTSNDLPSPRDRADAVRLVFQGDQVPGPAFASTAPISYARTRLATMLDEGEPIAYISPNVAMYFPCAELPHLDDGVAQAPNLLVVWHEADSPLDYTLSPFAGVLDLYELVRIPPVDASGPPFAEVAILAVDRRIPGARIAPPDRQISIS
jgi:hypothetical protein